MYAMPGEYATGGRDVNVEKFPRKMNECLTK